MKIKKNSPASLSRKLGLSISVLWEAAQNEDTQGGKSRKEENRPSERKRACGGSPYRQDVSDNAALANSE